MYDCISDDAGEFRVVYSIVYSIPVSGQFMHRLRNNIGVGVESGRHLLLMNLMFIGPCIIVITED